MLNHGAFSEKIRLLRYMEMREPLGTKCSGRASQRRVSRNVSDLKVKADGSCRASQRRVSRNPDFFARGPAGRSVAPRRGA